MRVFLAALTFCACTDELVCGPGTVKSGSMCVTSTPVVPCGDGGVIIGGNCYADPTLLCGPNTVWDPMLQRCKGFGGQDCAASCTSPSSQNLCISGHVVSFLDPQVFATSQSGLKVRVYNPLQFVSNPATAEILATGTVDDQGCYAIDGIDPGRLSVGLVALSVTDAGSPMGGTYAVTGVGATLSAGRNISKLEAYYIERATVDNWAGQVSDPTLLSDGMWIGWFLDPSGNPVAGVTPTRPGQDPAPSEIYCFRGNRMTLSTEDTTDATGLCAISPDLLTTHSGRCGASACSPPFAQLTGGTAPNVIFIEPVPQM